MLPSASEGQVAMRRSHRSIGIAGVLIGALTLASCGTAARGAAKPGTSVGTA